MTSVPTISVVTITFKDLDGLKRTVDSVRAQRYPGRIDHIVIDGGSGDEVVTYLSENRPGFAYWQSEPDRGRYDAMNTGISHATGDLVWFMHSGDCFSDGEAITDVVQSISTHGDAAELWGYGKVRRVGADGRDLGVWGDMPFDLRKFLMGRQPIPHQASFFGSSVLAELGGYDLDFGIAADQLYIYRAGSLREPVTVDRVVCNFDAGGAGSVRPLRENYADLRRLWDIAQSYPWGSRRRSRAILRVLEYRNRALLAGYQKLAAMRSRLRGER
jgi:glycosyltransferase involved in cell wall biosynthesis